MISHAVETGLLARRVPPRRVHFLALALVNVAFLFYGSLVPFHYKPLTPEAARSMAESLAFDDAGWSGSRTDLATNVLLTVPMGFFWMGALLVDRRRLHWGVPAILLTLLACLPVNFAVEFAQAWFPPRVPSQRDILAQACGSLAGILLWLVCGQTITNWVRSYGRSVRPAQRIDWLLRAYLAGFLAYSLLPLDLTVGIHDLYDKYRAGKILVVPFSHSYGTLAGLLYALATDVLVFVPVGAFAATCFTTERRPVRSLGSSLALGLSIAVGIELCQLFVVSRYSDATDLVTGACGVFLGAWWMRSLRGATGRAPDKPTPGARSWLWQGLVVLYVILLLALFWYPYDFTTEKGLVKERLRSFSKVPFGVIFGGSEMIAITQLLRKTLWFAPLGALLAKLVSLVAAGPAMRRVLQAGCLVLMAVIGVALELGQILLPRHVVDLTDVILYVGGGAVGMALATHLLATDTSSEPMAGNDRGRVDQ